MKKFIVSILSVAVFFIGLGGLVNQVGAKFKSDERALEIIRQTRIAIGGDEAIKNVRSLTIDGSAEQTFAIDGADRTEQGGVEINLQMPNQYSKVLKFGNGGAEGENFVRKEVRVIELNKDGERANPNLEKFGGAQKRFVIRKKDEGENADSLTDGVNADNHKFFVNKDLQFSGAGKFQQNEIFRTTFALLLSVPEGVDASYTFAGEEAVDGNFCDVILARIGGESFKLYIDKSSHLPRMLSYQGAVPTIFKFNRSEQPTEMLDDVKTLVVNQDGTQTERVDKEKTTVRRINLETKTAEYQVRFSDYRNVGGVRFPYKWTKSADGRIEQTIDVVNYEINPANIAEKFTKTSNNVMFRIKKPE